jgi:hypothetical protein
MSFAKLTIYIKLCYRLASINYLINDRNEILSLTECVVPQQS